jgi:hypothetical protein
LFLQFVPEIRRAVVVLIGGDLLGQEGSGINEKCSHEP